MSDKVVWNLKIEYVGLPFFDQPCIRTARLRFRASHEKCEWMSDKEGCNDSSDRVGLFPHTKMRKDLRNDTLSDLAPVKLAER